jgi:hypothetical protein
MATSNERCALCGFYDDMCKCGSYRWRNRIRELASELDEEKKHRARAYNDWLVEKDSLLAENARLRAELEKRKEHP